MLKVKQGDVEKFDIEAYQYNAEIMGEVNLSCEVYLDVPLTYFSLNMYVDINGENLYLSSFEPTGVKNTDNIYPKYSLVFESKRVQLKRKYFRDLTSETGIDWGTEYSFYGNIADFATRFQKNLTKYFLNNEWSIEVYGNHSQDVSVLFEASNLYLFDALKQMSEIWDKEWKIVSSGATNVIQVGFPQETLTHNFEYEGGNAGGGLTVIQKEVDTSNIITRMLSAGSTKNIPYQYFRELSASELAAGNVQDPNVAPLFSNGYYNLMPKCFREYIKGWNEGSIGTEYTPPRPTYTPEFWKGYDDGRKTFFGNLTYNPITYYESESIEVWGEREGIVEVNEDIFPTISGIDTRDEVVDVEQILSNEQRAHTSITRHHLDYDAIGDKFGQTLEIGEITITNANEEEFNYYGIINVLSGYSGTNSATISIKYQLENLSWQEEYSKTFSYNASSSDKRIYDNVKLTRNTTYKIYIIINGHTESIIISQFNSGYRFYQSLKSKYNQSNIINGYFQNSGNIFSPIILNTDYANSYTIHAITNEVSYIYGTFRTDIRMCSCDFKLVLQVDYGNGNFIDAPAYIDDEGIVYESYRLYTKTPNDLSSNTTYNFEDNYTFYLDGNYSYRLVTRIISITPNYKYNGNLLRTFYNQKSFIYNTTHSSSISLLHNIHAEAYLAWGQDYYNIEFTVAKALIDNAITLGIFSAAELTTLINGFESYLVEFNMDNLFTQKIGRPYKGYFSVWIKDIGFNINDYLSTETAQLNFTTGALAGEDYLFEILDVTPDTSRTSSAYRLKCLKSKADVDATGLAIPNTFKQGQTGDRFILLNINMPYDPYVFDAEERLETYVKAELDKVCDAKRAFSIEIYDPFISSFAETNKLITGNYIKIKHTNLIGSGSTATVQIKGITITQSKGDMFPKFAIILSEESSITRPTITRRGGGIIGDLYRRYRDLGDSLGNVTRNVSSINTNLGRTINVDTFNNNYRQVSGVNKEINALALSAKTTADEKNKCWAVKPIPPYYVGDQWLDSLGEEFNIGEVVYCIITRLEGEFNYNDWSLSRYKGTTEINTSINNVIGAIPSGRTVIEEINTVKGTAEGKNKGWTIKPIPPYYKGDQWLVGAGDVESTGLTAGDVLFCNTIRETGDFNLADWGGNRYIGEKEVNESIDDFSTNVIGEIPIGKTVFGKGDSLETKLTEVSLKVNNKTRIELNEVPDGTRTLFTASKIFLAGTADVYANRLKQYKGFDYTEASANSILFSVAPLTEVVLVLEAVENTNNENIIFADSAVKALCATNWGSGGEITYAQATIVTDLGSVFTGNIDIISFNELQYFTGLKSIGDYAFNYCNGLTSIIIPNSVTSIGNGAFNNCKELTSIIIPNSITSIGNVAFQNCTSLTSIEISTSVTSIGNFAFAYCSGLASVTIPNSVTSIGNSAFAGCANLTSIIIPTSVTSINVGVFSSCTSLTSIIIPNSVTSIGLSAFINCLNLTSITIPNSVTSIGNYAFYGCTGLTSITIEAITPPTLGADAFLNNTNLSHIYVPNASVDAYKAAAGWSAYADIISQII